MADINIGNISEFELDGSDLFDDSESFITELDDEGESIVGGYNTYRGNRGGQIIGDICGISVCAISGAIFNCGNTFCGNTIGLCGNTAVCGNTIADGF